MIHKALCFLVFVALAAFFTAAPVMAQDYGCRNAGDGVEFFVSKSLAAKYLGGGVPVFGAEIEGWDNNTPMTAAGDYWVAKVKGSSSGTQDWGFGRKKDGYPWYPSKKMVADGAVKQGDVVDNGFNAFNFRTTCR
ncbi:MAG: hypothetical protein WC715_04810 [Patescibacteria group bacterium]|jgi:hypothetical protein